ncbi:MAG: ribosome small subunit-dependent GTPase A [Eubacteriales bacterium]|nr:ribosome small subunit-dependent GTPase A [Eubacteriales bacterium]
MQGRVLSGVGGLYSVYAQGEIFLLRAQSKLRHKKLKPLVGDIVQFTPGKGEEDGWLEAIEPRRNELIRPAVANIDKLCAVFSASVPQADLLLADRLLIFARMRSIEPVLVVNKSDTDADGAQRIIRQYAQAQARCFAVSAHTGEGVDELRGYLAGSIHAFGGQSGVGKSSLMNALYGFSQEVGDISERIERGKNTTRSCELKPVPGGGMALDTPGFSLLDLPLMDPDELRGYYPEYAPYENKCRFIGCVHLYEPDCPVRDAVARGEIDPLRHERYQRLYEDMKIRWRERYD